MLKSGNWSVEFSTRVHTYRTRIHLIEISCVGRQVLEFCQIQIFCHFQPFSANGVVLKDTRWFQNAQVKYKWWKITMTLEMDSKQPETPSRFTKADYFYSDISDLTFSSQMIQLSLEECFFCFWLFFTFFYYFYVFLYFY